MLWLALSTMAGMEAASRSFSRRAEEVDRALTMSSRLVYWEASSRSAFS